MTMHTVPFNALLPEIAPDYDDRTGLMNYSYAAGWLFGTAMAVAMDLRWLADSHLGYLHNKTLGAAYPDRNIWHPVGRHTVWYSIEREGDPQSTTVLSAEMADAAGATRLPGHEESFYPGVVMLFPLTILSPSPWGFHVSLLEPKTPDLTTMWTQSWTTYGSASRAEAGKAPTPISLANLEGHPMESGNFQLEDMWICEMIQRNLRSPKFKVGPMAAGFGAESPIMHFQQSVLDYLNGDPGGSGV